MDMQKINIGNDIRIDFKIKTPEELGNADMAIKNLRCFLINTSDNNYLSHRIKRFPNEPFPQYYDPTEYTLRDCGSPKYNAIPVNGTIIDYKGFGIKSKKFDNHIYQAFSQEGEDGVYQAFFPKIHQKSFGKYKFVVAVSYYEKGWGKCDIHEITIDFGEIFEIVKEGGNTGYIVIRLYNETTPEPDPEPENPTPDNPQPEPETKGNCYYGFVSLPNDIGNYNIDTMEHRQSETASNIEITVPENEVYFAFVSTKKILHINIGNYPQQDMTYVGKSGDLYYHYFDSPQRKGRTLKDINVY